MATRDAFIAVDWGTTNRRIYLITGDGDVLDTFRDDRGVLNVDPHDYAADIAAARQRLGSVPVIAAGMVGSGRGWIEVPYVDAPADIASLASAAVEIADEVFVVPGVALMSGKRPDVMRGEEVQVLGAVAAGLAPPDALFCQPGTHNKWIVVRGAAVADFSTAMTGELFSLIKSHGTLAGMLDGLVSDCPAYHEGLARGMESGDLSVALFEVRSSVLLERRPPADAASYASGILIGADVAARPDISGNEIHLLASGPLAQLYAIAIAQRGGSVLQASSHAAFAKGIHAIWKELA